MPAATTTVDDQTSVSLSERTRYFSGVDSVCQKRTYDAGTMIDPLRVNSEVTSHAADATNPCALPTNWISSNDPSTALDLAIQRGVSDLNVKVTIEEDSAVDVAGDFDSIRIIDRITQVCTTDGILGTKGATALSVALVRGRTDYIEKLLRAGASLIQATCSELGLTAHHLVCATGDVDLFEYFVKVAGAANFFAARSEFGNVTPFHVAAALGKMDLLDRAIEVFADAEEEGKPLKHPETGATLPHPASVAAADGDLPAHYLARWRFIPAGDSLLCSTSLSLPRADVTTDTLCDLLRFAKTIPDDLDTDLPMWWINLRPCLNKRKEHVLHLCHPFVASELIETLVPSHGHASSANLRADSDERSAVSHKIVDTLFDDVTVDGENCIVCALKRGEGEFVGVVLKLLPGDEIRPRMAADIDPASKGSLLHLAVRHNQPDAARHLVNVAGQEASNKAVKRLFEPTFAGDDAASETTVMPSNNHQDAWCRGAFAYACSRDEDGENTPLHVAAASTEDCSSATTAVIDSLVRGVTRLAAEASASSSLKQHGELMRDLAEQLLWRTPNRSDMTPLHQCVTGDHGEEVATAILKGASAIESSLSLLSPAGNGTFSPPGLGGGEGPPVDPFGSTPGSPTLHHTGPQTFLDTGGPPSASDRTVEKKPAPSPKSGALDEVGHPQDQKDPLALTAVGATHGTFDLNALELACSQGRSCVVAALLGEMHAQGGGTAWLGWARGASGDTCAHLAAKSGDEATVRCIGDGLTHVPETMRATFLGRSNRNGETASQLWQAAYHGRDPAVKQLLS